MGWLSAVLAFLVVLFFLGGGWYFSGQIGSETYVDPASHHDDVVVVAAPSNSVTLRPTGTAPSALSEDTVYGLDWGIGYGQVSEVRDIRGDAVTRKLRLLSGRPPMPGRPADLQKEAFPSQARQALDVPARQVGYRSPAGTFPAWYAPGHGTTWAVLVHGKGVTRSEMFRLMRTTTDLGMPSLDISYRNDAENGGGMPHFGATEWPDLEAAVTYALGHGARRVVLVGCSMGAAISASFLEKSPLARHVGAVVFDAPMLDYAAAVSLGAAKRELPVLGVPIPGALTWTARQLADLRYGLDSGSMDYLDDTDWLTVPALVFHGTADETVPYSVTNRLAAAEPDLVTKVLVDGAEHVGSWNMNPQRYDTRVHAFLAGNR